MIPSVDVSLEYSHIYADQRLGAEQLLSVQHFNNEVLRLKQEGKTYSSLVLVDDLHVSNMSISLKELRLTLESQGGQVDKFILESELSNAVRTLLVKLPRQSLYFQPFRAASKKVLFLSSSEGPVALASFLNETFKPTCALLIATWNLARLGCIEISGIPVAQYSISILDAKFKPVEMKALKIIKASKFAKEAGRIEHRFYNT